MHIHEVTNKHQLSMLTALDSLKIPSKHQIVCEVPVLSTASARLHSPQESEVQKAIQVRLEQCNAFFTGTEVMFSFAAWHGHPRLTTEQSRVLSLCLFQD